MISVKREEHIGESRSGLAQQGPGGRLARHGCAGKTILDTLRPAADAAMAGEALGQVLLAAWRGMRSTRPLVARRGLALRLGARSAGHLDAGAVSCFLLLAAMVH
jgi:dihydroxyacetone kinase